MKVNEILYEALADPARIVQLIQQNCKPFLSQAGWENPLWRGISASLPSISTQTNRPDRMPLTTNKAISKAADEWFLEHMGVRYRSHAVFTSGYISHAQSYGNVYAVLPIGDFKFCWSPIVEDMFMMVSDVNPRVPRHATTLPPIIEDALVKRLAEAEYQTDDLVAAINTSSEIMIHCNKYYLIARQTFDTTQKLALGKK